MSISICVGSPRPQFHRATLYGPSTQRPCAPAAELCVSTTQCFYSKSCSLSEVTSYINPEKWPRQTVRTCRLGTPSKMYRCKRTGLSRPMIILFYNCGFFCSFMNISLSVSVSWCLMQARPLCNSWLRDDIEPDKEYFQINFQDWRTIPSKVWPPLSLSATCQSEVEQRTKWNFSAPSFFKKYGGQFLK